MTSIQPGSWELETVDAIRARVGQLIQAVTAVMRTETMQKEEGWWVSLVQIRAGQPRCSFIPSGGPRNLQPHACSAAQYR